MRAWVLAVLVFAACGGNKPAPTTTSSSVSNQAESAPATAPDAGAPVSCDMECSTDEVGCLLAEFPPACCAKYSSACKLNKNGNGTGS